MSLLPMQTRQEKEEEEREGTLPLVGEPVLSIASGGWGISLGSSGTVVFSSASVSFSCVHSYTHTHTHNSQVSTSQLTSLLPSIVTLSVEGDKSSQSASSFIFFAGNSLSPFFSFVCLRAGAEDMARRGWGHKCTITHMR